MLDYVSIFSYIKRLLSSCYKFHLVKECFFSPLAELPDSFFLIVYLGFCIRIYLKACSIFLDFKFINYSLTKHAQPFFSFQNCLSSVSLINQIIQLFIQFIKRFLYIFITYYLLSSIIFFLWNSKFFVIFILSTL